VTVITIYDPRGRKEYDKDAGGRSMTTREERERREREDKEKVSNCTDDYKG
jgi:hypothetical protein